MKPTAKSTIVFLLSILIPSFSSAQSFGCKASADLPLSGFVHRLGSDGTGGFSLDLRIQRNNVDLYTDAFKNVQSNQTGKSKFPRSPLAETVGLYRSYGSGSLSAARSKNIVDKLNGREAFHYYGQRTSTVGFVHSLLSSQENALVRMQGSLIGIRNAIEQWQEAGLISRTIHQLKSCASVCGAELVHEANKFENRYETLVELVNLQEFDSASDGIMSHFTPYKARINLMKTYFKQYEQSISAASRVAYHQAQLLSEERIRTQAGFVSGIIGGTEFLDKQWVSQEINSVRLIQENVLDKTKSGRDTLTKNIMKISNLLDTNVGIRRHLLAYQRLCN